MRKPLKGIHYVGWDLQPKNVYTWAYRFYFSVDVIPSVNILYYYSMHIVRATRTRFKKFGVY
jgi:hypothetical protein